MLPPLLKQASRHFRAKMNKEDPKKDATYRLAGALTRLNIFGVDVGVDNEGQMNISFPKEYVDNLITCLEEVADAEDEMDRYFKEQNKNG